MRDSPMRERDGERRRRNEGRKTNRQADSRYTEREFCSRYALSMGPRAPPQPPRRLPRRWLTRGPLICDPDPPYLNNPGYGFHLSSQDAHPHPRTLTYIREESLRGKGKGSARRVREGTEVRDFGGANRRARILRLYLSCFLRPGSPREKELFTEYVIPRSGFSQ